MAIPKANGLFSSVLNGETLAILLKIERKQLEVPIIPPHHPPCIHRRIRFIVINNIYTSALINVLCVFLA